MVCDLAETYHLFNYTEFPPSLVGTLVFGLNEDSRVKRKLTGRKITLDQWLLARISDDLRFQSWAMTKDGKHNHNRPQSVLEHLIGTKKKEEYATFSTFEEFEEMWNNI